MSLFDFMAREHQRIELELSRCIEAAQSARLTGADRATARRLRAYLVAQERTLFPALIALAPDDAEEPALRSQRVKALALVALAQPGSGGEGPSAAMRLLHRAWQAHGTYQQGRLRSELEEIFTGEELRQLAGAMQVELAASAGERRRIGVRQVAQAAWRGLRARLPGGRSRAVPTLQKTVFVYRAVQDRM